MFEITKEILKVRQVGRDVILFTHEVYYSEIVLHCKSQVTAEKIAVTLLHDFNIINGYLSV